MPYFDGETGVQPSHEKSCFESNESINKSSYESVSGFSPKVRIRVRFRFWIQVGVCFSVRVGVRVRVINAFFSG